MRRFRLAVLALAAVMAALPAHAANKAAMAPVSAPVGQPDLISFSSGYFDFDKSEPKTNSADFRLEYRFGVSLLPKLSSYFSESDAAQLRPFLGFETTSRNLQFEHGGFNLDWNFAPHGIFTWQEAIGYLNSGDQRGLGGTMQFRSQAEAGYRFDNDMRLTAAFSHISNAKTTRFNPGAEILGVYFHVPTQAIFGH